MPTIRERILQYLSKHPEGADDDELASALNLKWRQQANDRCRILADEGLIDRRVVDGKIRNYFNGTPQALKHPPSYVSTEDPNEPWFWEGNVQESVARHLRGRGCVVVRMADPKKREKGKDLEVSRYGQPLWITAKGYPKGTKMTSPSTQAGHWFKQALFDVIAWRSENGDAYLAVALPDYPRYRDLASKVSWLLEPVQFAFLWVQQDGAVEVQGTFLLPNPRIHRARATAHQSP